MALLLLLFLRSLSFCLLVVFFPVLDPLGTCLLLLLVLMVSWCALMLLVSLVGAGVILCAGFTAAARAFIVMLRVCLVQVGLLLLECSLLVRFIRRLAFALLASFVLLSVWLAGSRVGSP